jgi:dephospho-CoA kinase
VGVDPLTINREDYFSALNNLNNSLTIFLSLLLGSIPFVLAGWSYIRNRTMREELERRHLIREHLVPTREEETRIMEHYYQDAVEITVYAGDFSWLSASPTLQRTVQGLSARGKISLISSDQPSSVRNAMGDALYDTLKSRIYYGNHRSLRCSVIVYPGGAKSFLYRYRNPVDEKYHICAVRHLPESAYLLDAIERLSNFERGPRTAIFVCGPPASGKTLAANWLRAFGFRVISAGDLVRDIAKERGLSTSRESLIQVGGDYLKQHGYDHFARELLDRAGSHNRVVFDGIRPPEVVTFLKRQFDASSILYLHADEQIWKQRLMDFKGGTDGEVLAILNSQLEMDAKVIRGMADRVISNNRTKEEELRRSVVEAVVHLVS